MRVKEPLSISVADALRQHLLLNSENSRLDAELLLCEVLACERSYLRTWPDRLLSDVQTEQYDVLLTRRHKGEPLAYLIERCAFWTLDLKVSSNTLIPRQDTETLVEQALALDLPTNAKVLDLGTGTGAIALALASERPGWQVTASDRFSEVVTLASENVERLGLKNINIVCSNWFDSIPKEGFHLIVSNPPYIDAEDEHLGQGDLRFEPQMALVSADKGLADIRHIVTSSIHYLHPDGWLLLEHGYQQGQDVCRCFCDKGYRQVKTVSDLGHNERVTMGQLGVSE